PGHRALRGARGGTAGRERAERAAGGEAQAGVAPVPGSVPDVHADHPDRGGSGVAGHQGVEHRGPADPADRAERGDRDAAGGQRAEAARNALRRWMRAPAGGRRDAAGAQTPAEEVVAGDVALIAAGDEVPADGRIVAASALQIDESALTGESTPAAKDAGTL